MPEDNLTDKLGQLFKDPSQAARVADILVPSKRPAGWSKKSNAPYFKEIYALEMKQTLDTVAHDKKDVVYDYATFESMGMSRSTVYLRVNQSLKYLLEYMDPGGIYNELYRNKIQITKERGVGVRISLLPGYREGAESLFQPRTVVPKEEAPLWRRKLEEWLENAQPGDQFYKEGLALNPDEIKELEDSFINVPQFLPNITSFSIKIVRIDEGALG